MTKLLGFFPLVAVCIQQMSFLPLPPPHPAMSFLVPYLVEVEETRGSTRFLSNPIFFLRSSPLTRLVDARGLASQSVCANFNLC